MENNVMMMKKKKKENYNYKKKWDKEERVIILISITTSFYKRFLPLNSEHIPTHSTQSPSEVREVTTACEVLHPYLVDSCLKSLFKIHGKRDFY